MRYSVFGADRETGEEVTIIVEAATPSAAEDAAYRRGLLVQRLDLVDASMAPPTTPQAPVFTGQRAPTVIEKTSKEWKKWMLFFGLLFVMSIPTCMAGGAQDHHGDGQIFFMFGTLMFVVGGVGFVVAKVMAWWHHG